MYTIAFGGHYRRFNAVITGVYDWHEFSLGGFIHIVPAGEHPGFTINVNLAFITLNLVIYYCDHKDHGHDRSTSVQDGGSNTAANQGSPRADSVTKSPD